MVEEDHQRAEPVLLGRNPRRNTALFERAVAVGCVADGQSDVPGLARHERWEPRCVLHHPPRGPLAADELFLPEDLGRWGMDPVCQHLVAVEMDVREDWA
eukprot:1423392-Rhodomonas_salina.1